jgi:UMF1 family MFS transporter
VQTAIGQFSSLALERFDLDGPALVRLILLVQAVALPGALAVGWFSTRFGRRPATAVCLAGWVVVLALSWFVTTPTQLHGLAVLLALVLGGIQSVLRATIAALAPAGHAAASFGVMQVGTKLPRQSRAGLSETQPVRRRRPHAAAPAAATAIPHTVPGSGTAAIPPLTPGAVL